MDEDTTKTTETAAETFRREHGRAARTIVVFLCAPPLLAATALGLVVGLALALPGLALAMLAAVPYWIWGKRP